MASYRGIIPPTQREIEMIDAATRLGIKDLSTLDIFFEDNWQGRAIQAISAGSGTRGPDATRMSFMTASTGVTINSIGGFYLLTGGGAPVTLPSGSGGEFYLSTKFMLTTAVDGTTILSAMTGSSGTSDYLILGVDGAASITKFVARFTNSGAALVSSVSIDLNVVHQAKLFRKAGTTWFSIDNEPLVSGNTFPGASHLGWGMNSQNGNITTNRAIATDWQFAAVSRPTS